LHVRYATQTSAVTGQSSPGLAAWGFSKKTPEPCKGGSKKSFRAWRHRFILTLLFLNQEMIIMLKPFRQQEIFMQPNRRTFLAQLGQCAILPFMAPVSLKAEPNIQIKNLSDNGKALVNPLMGWTMHYYSNVLDNYGSKLAPADTLDDFPGLSTVYLRIPWSFIETEEGKFNWEVLDTPAQRWISKGKKVAFRITACESWLRYATPEWVVKAGAKGYDFGNNKEYWEPAYDDPIFLQKVDQFVAAMAERYDDNANVAFIDVGHYGLWGEGHTIGSTRIEYSLEALKAIIDLYLRHFHNTLLCISDDYAGHNKPGFHFPITDYAFSKGVTLRDDSILVQPPPRSWFHAEMAQQFWPKFPVILEHEHFGLSKGRNAWSKELLLKSVEEYHASYMSIHWWPRILLEENRDVIEKINLRMGYRLQLHTIAWPEQVTLGQPFPIETSLANAGVAPCYPGGFLCYTLKDRKGGIVAVLVDPGFNVRDLQPGKPHEAVPQTITSLFTIAPAFKDSAGTFFRNAAPGEYALYVSVGKKDGTPVLELPMDDGDGMKRYRVGKLVVRPRANL
jgi:hypothetical protein